MTMDWENERYVRAYTRDTEDWLCLSWEAQALFLMLLRKVDRAGLLTTKRGPGGVAVQVRMPVDVVTRALPELLTDGCIRECRSGYVMPNYLAAQEARQSDKQRQRESRAARLAREMLAGELDDLGDTGDRKPALVVTQQPEQVPDSDIASRSVTETSHAVTRGHPSLARPAEPAERETARAVGPPKPSLAEIGDRYRVADQLFERQETLRREVAPQQYRPANKIQSTDAIVKLLSAGERPEDLHHVLEVYANEARQRTVDPFRFFNGSTNWRPDQVAIAKGTDTPGTAPPRALDYEPAQGAPKPRPEHVGELTPEQQEETDRLLAEHRKNPPPVPRWVTRGTTR